MMELLSVVTCPGSAGSTGSGRNCQLPATALQLVMSSVKVSDRHGCTRSLALVCKSWAAAVAAASMEGIVLHRCADYESFQHWLNKYGRQLKKLRANLCPIARLAGAAVSRSQLPCPPVSVLFELQQLHLQHAELQLSGPNSICSALAAATKLSSLRLENCAITLSQTGPADAAAVAADVTTAGAELLAAIVQVPALQDLSLSDLRVDWVLSPTLGERVNFSQHLAELPTADIQALQGLTQLQLQGVRFENSAAALQHIGSMTSLQHLQLGGWPNRPYEHSTAWPAFADPGRAAPLHMEVSRLTGLTNLRHFGLLYARLDTAIMTSQQRAAWFVNVSTLLLWLPELPQLSSLQLQGVQGLCMPPEASGSLRFLTSGTALQHIDLRGTVLNAECWKQVFPVAVKLEGITSLMIGDNWPLADPLAGSGNLYATALQSCPNLRSVVIVTSGSTASMRPALDLLARPSGQPNLWRALGRATSLTSLSLSMKGCKEPWDSYALARLPELKHLHLTDCSVGGSDLSVSPVLYGEHILLLRNLSQLTFLGISGPKYPGTVEQCRELYSMIAAALDDEPSAVQLVLGDKVLRLAFVNQPSPSSPAWDVSQQLQRQLGKLTIVIHVVVWLKAFFGCVFLCGVVAGILIMFIRFFQWVIPGARKII